jgi:predicted transcriptional regulator
MKTIEDLIKEGSQVTLNVNLDDLKEFAKTFANEMQDGQKEKEPRFYTRDEVMKFLHITSDTTLWKWEKKGIIRSKKIGGRNLYPASEIEQLMK